MRWLAIVPLLSSLVWVQSALAEKLLLTDQERAWIVSHPVVRIAVDPEWKPIEYIENGQYKGLASEYIKKIGQLTGLRFEIGHDAGWGTVTEVLQKNKWMFCRLLYVVLRRHLWPHKSTLRKATLWVPPLLSPEIMGLRFMTCMSSTANPSL